MAEATAPLLVNDAADRPSLGRELRELAHFSNLLWSLVQRDLTVRYKRSVLGFMWTMLNPLIMMVIMTLVFSTIFKFQIDFYAIYFLSEYLVWTFFAQTTTTAMTSLAWNGALMKKVRVPKLIFAVSTILSGLVNLALSYLPLFLIMLFLGAPIRPAVLFLPVGFAVIALFTLGVALILSSLAVYFEDVSHMYQAGSMGWMYLTPIIYPITIIPEKMQWVVRANPLTHLFKLVRDPVYHGRLPEAHIVLASGAVAVVTLTIGWLVFRRLSRGFYVHL